MKHILFNTISFLCILLLFSGCFPKKYIYDFEDNGLKHPIEQVKAEFKAEQDRIAVKVTNNNPVPIKLLWEESSFVVDGRAMRPVYGNTSLYRMSYPQLFTVIPENSYIENVVAPWDNLFYVMGGKGYNGYWAVLSFFPSRHPRPRNTEPRTVNIGKSLRFNLCVEIEGVKKYVEVGYTVKGVHLEKVWSTANTNK